MRSGRLLAEESPAALLANYRCTNLEDVFLKLSRKQGTTNNAVNELNISNLSLSALAFGNKKDAPVYISQDSGVVGLNFHQSKEVLINDHNGSAMGVSYHFWFSFAHAFCQTIFELMHVLCFSLIYKNFLNSYVSLLLAFFSINYFFLFCLTTKYSSKVIESTFQL